MFGSLFKRGKKQIPVPPQEAAMTEPVTTKLDEKMSAAGSVGKRYPGVAGIGINMYITSPLEKVEPTLRGKSFTPESMAYFEFRCKNVECCDGGFDLTEVIDEMAACKDTESTGRRICEGWESKDQIGHRRCYYELNFRILVKYA